MAIIFHRIFHVNSHLEKQKKKLYIFNNLYVYVTVGKKEE